MEPFKCCKCGTTDFVGLIAHATNGTWCMKCAEKQLALTHPTPPTACVVTEGEIEKAISDGYNTRKHWPDNDVDMLDAINESVTALLNRAGGRVVDVVPLSMECLSAVLNNEYMDKQLEGIQAAILAAISTGPTGRTASSGKGE